MRLTDVVKIIGGLALGACGILLTVLFPAAALSFVAGVFAGLYYAHYAQRRSRG
jgi:hypothetical protein